MKRILILTASAFALGACAAPVAPLLCDREAIAWDKFGEPSEFWEVCEAPAAPLWGIFTPRETRDYDDEPRPDTPTQDRPDTDKPDTDKPDTDKPDTDKPDTDKPTGKPKDDNSDANGKGGNRHDRDDKAKPSQEIAEGKKGV